MNASLKNRKNLWWTSLFRNCSFCSDNGPADRFRKENFFPFSGTSGTKKPRTCSAEMTFLGALSKGLPGKGLFFCCVLGALLFFGTFPGEAWERVLLIGTSPEGDPFAECLEKALEESFPEISRMEIRPFLEGASPLEVLRSQNSSEDLVLGILSLQELGLLLPEALSLGTPFLFHSSRGVELFFEESRYWELLRELFRERTSDFLGCPVEGGGFVSVLDGGRTETDPLEMEGHTYAASWEAEAAVLYAFGATPTLFPRRDGVLAFLRGDVKGCMLPLGDLFFPAWQDKAPSLLLSSGLYDLRFFVLSRELRECLGEKELHLLQEALEKANRKVREDREEGRSRILNNFEEKGARVRELSLEEEASFAAVARNAYLRWLETKISRSWIDLPLQEAQDANSMVAGQ